jgi:uncharacterized protein (TIGR02453 family)
MPTRYFTPGLFAFLRDLAENNDRTWFKANQERYEEMVRRPALAFVEDLAEPLLAISRHFTADPRPVGGSLFRIQRDTRFAHDKTPYKTHTGLHFRHVATRDDVHAPGFYLHLEPGNCFTALGLWQPATDRAQAIRAAIADNSAAWVRATRRPPFSASYALGEGNPLSRPPQGFAQAPRLHGFRPGHPGKGHCARLPGRLRGDDALRRAVHAVPLRGARPGVLGLLGPRQAGVPPQRRRARASSASNPDCPSTPPPLRPIGGHAR